LSIRYSDRLEEANILPSVGSVGDSYGNLEKPKNLRQPHCKTAPEDNDLRFCTKLSINEVLETAFSF
jgi:hypothetical protein